MNIRASKSQENKALAGEKASRQRTSEQALQKQAAVKQPEATTPLKLQNTILNSPRVQQLKAYQDMANNSPQVRQLKAVQEMADNHASVTTQLKKSTDKGQTAASEGTFQRKANHTGLPDKLKSGVEHISGFSMDDVKVHYNSTRPAQLQAHAYAQGTDIHIAPGQEKHLPHEAWHVVQQKQGRVKPTLQMKSGVAVNDDKYLEKEADVMGAKAFRATIQLSGAFTSGRTVNNIYQLERLKGNYVPLKDELKDKTWKDYVLTLSPAEQKEIGEKRDLLSGELQGKYLAQTLSGASTKPESDIDLSFLGMDAGKNVKEAEEEMAAKFGPAWESMLRMNFYTGLERLMAADIAILELKDAGKGSDITTANSTANRNKITLELNKIKQAAHRMKVERTNAAAGINPSQETLTIAGKPYETGKLLAALIGENNKARKHELYTEIDGLMVKLDESKKRNDKNSIISISANISELQLLANFYTDEAYIGPGMSFFIKNGQFNTMHARASISANQEMIEHIIHEHHGDAQAALKQYEIYKYIYRICDNVKLTLGKYTTYKDYQKIIEDNLALANEYYNVDRKKAGQHYTPDQFKSFMVVLPKIMDTLRVQPQPK